MVNVTITPLSGSLALDGSIGTKPTPSATTIGYVWASGTNNAGLWYTDGAGTTAQLNAAAGGGDIGGTVSDNYIPIADGDDTLANFTPAYVEGYNIIIGRTAQNTTTDADDNTMLGHNAGYALTTGDRNVFIGRNAGDQTTTANSNVAIGRYAMGGAGATVAYSVAIGTQANNSIGGTSTGVGHMSNYAAGQHKTAVGYQANLYPSGNDNTAVGHQALLGASAGTVSAYSNVAIGKQSMASATTAHSNVVVGNLAGYTLTTGYYNTYIGKDAGSGATTSAHSNVAVGFDALSSNHGAGNVAIGRGALRTTTDANQVAIGYSSLASNTAGEKNTAVGYDTLTTNTTGNYNTAMGHQALALNVHGDYNTAFGYKALLAAATADGTGGNTAIGGYMTLGSVTAGIRNNAMGHSAGHTLTTGNYNDFIGYQAAYSNVHGDYNVAIGRAALYYNTPADGAGRNVAIGSWASYGPGTTFAMTGTTAIGYAAGYWTSGNANVWIGEGAGYGGEAVGNTSTQSVSIGAESSKAITTANNHVAVGYAAANDITTGADGVYIGKTAGQKLTTQNYNVVIGADAMNAATGVSDSVVIGRQAMGGAAATGDDNVIMGYRAAYDLTTGYSNVIMGHSSAENITEGHKNIIAGHSAGGAITTAHSNVAIGYQALDSTTVGSENVAIGAYAGQALVGTTSSVYGGFSVFVGHTAGYQMTGNVSYGGNTMVGHAAGYSATGADRSTGIGASAMYYADGAKYNTAVGRVAGAYAKGTGSTHVGDSSGYRVSGNYNTSVGYEALSGASSGTGYGTAKENVAIGRQALASVTSANRNTVAGYTAGFSMTDGHNNNIFGYQAGYAITTGFGNVLSGYQTGKALTDGVYNTMTGVQAGLYETGDYNVMMGHRAGEGGSGDPDTLRSVFIGYLSGYRQSGASYNVAVGTYSAAGADFSGGSNVMMGYSAGQNATTANANVFLGYYAGSSGTTAQHNVVIGNQAGQELTTGTQNAFVGSNSGRYITIGHNNIGMGYGALNALVEGDKNIAIGSFAANATVSADGVGNNIAIGYQAMTTNTTGVDNVVIGGNALDSNTGGKNVIIGTNAAQGATTMDASTIIGHQAAGGGAPTGDYNTIVGYQAGYALNGAVEANVFLGHRAGYTNTTGGSNTYIGYTAGHSATIGEKNVAIGHSALYTNVDGDKNIAIGWQALYSLEPAEDAGENTAVGHQAGRSVTTGTGNVFLGHKAGYNTDHDTESNKLVIANSNTTTPLIDGDFSSASVTINGNLSSHHLSPVADDTYTLGTPAKQWQELHISDIIYNKGYIHMADSTGLAGTNRIYASGANLYWNTSKLNDQSSTAVETGTVWEGPSSTTYPLAFVEDQGGRLLRTESAANFPAYLSYNTTTALMTVRNTSFYTMKLGGSAAMGSIVTGGDTSNSDTALATSSFVMDNAGSTSPGGSDTQIQFNNGGAFGGVSGFTTTDDGSDVTLTSATASKPVFTIENTNADNTPPGLTFYKNTASPASGDQAGSIKFDSEEATSGDRKTYWEIQSRINDPTNTTPNGQLNFYGLDGDSPGFIHQFQFINSQFSVLDSNGVGPTMSCTGTNGGQFKTAGSKMRLQAKSDSTGEIHMMANYVGINTTSPTNLLCVSGNASPMRLYGTSTGKVEFDVSTSGDFTIDSDDDIRLDAGGQDIVLKGAGSEFGRLTNSSQDFIIQNTQNDKDIIFKTVDNTSTTTVMTIDGSESRVGIGTTAPNNTLEVAGVIRGTNYIWQKQDGTPGVLFGNGGDADIYYDGTNMIFNAARVGSGKESHITTVHASGASFQKDLGESLFIRAIHGGFDQNAILAAAPNIQYVAPAGPSAPGTSAIPTELPLAEAGNEGLEITVMQTWAADPTAALQVQASTGSPDVIYEGGSNTASANVSVAAYRGANKTFIQVAEAIWVVKG